MNMPGFSAEASLYKTRTHYTCHGHILTLEGGVYPTLVRRTAGSITGGPLVLGFTCTGLSCSCSGDNDCNDMFSSDVCGDIAACYHDGTCACLRI